MRPRTRNAAVGIGAVAVASGAVLAGSLGASAASPTTLHVQEISNNATYVPVGQLTGSKASASQGDYVAFSDPLVTPGSQTQVGRVQGVCWLTAPKASRFYCSVNFMIYGKGQIASTGLFDATGKTTTASITGGTGQYRSARGVVKLTGLSQTKNDFVITIDG